MDIDKSQLCDCPIVNDHPLHFHGEGLFKTRSGRSTTTFKHPVSPDECTWCHEACYPHRFYTDDWDGPYNLVHEARKVFGPKGEEDDTIADRYAWLHKCGNWTVTERRH